MAPSQRLRVLRIADVEHKVGLSRARVDWLEARGQFPRRIPLGERSVGWLESEVDAWLRARIAMREDAALEAEARRKRDPNRWLKQLSPPAP